MSEHREELKSDSSMSTFSVASMILVGVCKAVVDTDSNRPWSSRSAFAVFQLDTGGLASESRLFSGESSSQSSWTGAT